MPKHMKLPNGFGQISKLNKPLRNPYRAMITVGTNVNGRPICKLLKPKAYFKTYNEAYMALMDYHRNPYDLDTASMTLEDLYKVWIKEHEENVTTGTARNASTAWKHCKPIHNSNIKELKTSVVKTFVESLDTTSQLKRKVKILLGQMYKYAIEMDWVDRNPADFKLSSKISRDIESSHKTHLSFTEDEISVMFDHLDLDGLDIVLIQCYTGWRPQELLNINIEDIKDGFITGGMKTDAGRNRIVPIHPKISKLIEARISDRDNGRLFLTKNGIPMEYRNYLDVFNRNIKQLGLSPEHKPHDGRKTFVTLCKKYKVDEYAIKRIVGHKINDLTEIVYTDRPYSWLLEEVVKIH